VLVIPNFFKIKLYQIWTPPQGGVIALVARELIRWASGKIYDLVHDLYQKWTPPQRGVIVLVARE
jgi:hypothetical protein